MLRALVLVLLVANVAVLVWTQGWGRAAPDPSRTALQHEPARLQPLAEPQIRQLQERSCVEIGPLENDEALRQARAALQRVGLTEAQTQLDTQERAGVWGVVTIKMPNKEFQQRKEETYRKGRIPYEPLAGFPDEQPSLLLSRHPSPNQAEAARKQLENRAYRGLRVLQLEAAQRRHQLRLAALDGLQLGQIKALGAVWPKGAQLSACRNGAAAASAAAEKPAASTPAGASR
ncbi:hypothetical protein ACG0Z6_04615 [Roseateles sp. BYS180W]|uniref:SPOR domain-containing protein n=1 Tax=Roseateles rivi TaxID=3299028 RepID=A0ABW7FT73_9BURK